MVPIFVLNRIFSALYKSCEKVCTYISTSTTTILSSKIFGRFADLYLYLFRHATENFQLPCNIDMGYGILIQRKYYDRLHKEEHRYFVDKKFCCE